MRGRGLPTDARTNTHRHRGYSQGVRAYPAQGGYTPRPLAEMREVLPEAYDELIDTMHRMEAHYRDMQDMEFTVENGKLFLLQTRNGKRTAAAALKVASDLVDEGVITKEEALLRIEPDQLDQLLHPAIDPSHGEKPIAKGLPASRRA